MNITALISVLIFSVASIMGQEIKNLFPSYINTLDFSDEAKAEWAILDTLLHQLSSGKISWDKMSLEEQSLVDKYSEFYSDIWDIVGGGCSWYCAGGPEEVTASSFLGSQGENSYTPENAHDLSYKTAWVEGVAGYGIGEYLTYHFQAGSPRITEIIIVNGYVKNQTAWKNNSRVKKIKMYLNDGPFAILNLEDKVANQGFKFGPIGNSDTSGAAKWTMKFEVLDVYKGDKYDDVAISEIYFNGIDVHCLIKGTKVRLVHNITRNIEDLEIGDSIIYIDLKTRKERVAKIENLEATFHNELVTYIFVSGLEITATQDHPFFINDKGWASAEPANSAQYKGFESINEIQTGDLFLTLKGMERLTDIKYFVERQITYTISKLSEGNNFIANGLTVGVEELND